MGDSDKPFMRYSTLEMARDTLELVDYLGWTSLRQLHVVGVSMGGMIAQELVRPPDLQALGDQSRQETLMTDVPGFDDPGKNSFAFPDIYSCPLN